MPSKPKKVIKAWIIVNKDFPEKYLAYPNLYIASTYFAEKEATWAFKTRNSKYLKLVPVTITIK